MFGSGVMLCTHTRCFPGPPHPPPLDVPPLTVVSPLVVDDVVSVFVVEVLADAETVNVGLYHVVVTVFTIGFADAVSVFPTTSSIFPCTFIVICHVIFSPLDGVLPSWLVLIGSVNTVDPVFECDVVDDEYPPVPDAEIVIVSVSQFTSCPDAVHVIVTRMAVTSLSPM